MKHLVRTLAIVCAALSPAAGLAQQADPEATTVEALIVQARLPGPPWWKVTNGDRTVYILSLPTTMHDGVRWDQSLLERRLGRADRTIMPATFGSMSVDARSPNGLMSELPPDLAARLRAAAATVRRQPRRYTQMSILEAASFLSQDLHQQADLDKEGAYSTYRAAAQVMDLFGGGQIVQVGSFRRDDAGMSTTARLACLEEVISAVEAGEATFLAASRGWASGDIRAALAGPRGDRVWRCGQDHERVIAAYVREIAGALNDNSIKETVAGVPLPTLVAEHGVIIRLRELGYEVIDPAGLQD